MLGRIGALLLGTAVAVALARWLGPSARGVFAIVTLTPTILVAIANLGLGSSAVYFVSRDPARFGTALANATLLTAVASAVIALTAVVARSLIAQAVPALADPWLLAAVLASVPVLLLYTFVHPLLQAMRSFAWSSALLVVGYGLYLAALFVFVVALGLGLGGAVAGWLIAHALLLVVGLYALRRTGSVRRPDLGLLGIELAYGVPSWGGSLGMTVTTRAPLFLAGILLPPDEVGRFAVAITLAELLWYPAESVGVGLGPLTARASRNGATVPTAVVTRSVLAVTAVGGSVMVVAAGPLLTVLFGHEFAAAADFLRVLVPGVVALSVSKVLMSDLIGRGRPGLVFLAFAVGSVVSTGLGGLVIGTLPGPAPAVVSSVAYAAATAVFLTAYTRVTRTSIRSLLLPSPAADTRYVREVLVGIVRRGRGMSSGTVRSADQ